MGTHLSQFGLRADFHTLAQTSVFRYAITHMGAIMALSSRLISFVLHLRLYKSYDFMYTVMAQLFTRHVHFCWVAHI